MFLTVAAICGLGVIVIWAWLIAITPGTFEGKLLGYAVQLAVIGFAAGFAATYPGDLPGDSR